MNGVRSSALTAPTALKVCKETPHTTGLWNSNECGGSSVSAGRFAWAWPTNHGTETVYCVLGGAKFTEALCGHEGTGPFGEETVAEKFPKFQGELLLSILTATVASLPTAIDCKAGTFGGQPLSPTLASGVKIEYSSCIVTKPEKCIVRSYEPSEATGKIATRSIDWKQLSLTEVEFTPEAEGTFAHLEYSGAKCSVNEVKVPVDGIQKCRFGGPASASTPALLHLIECFTSGSKLTLGPGPEKATYEGTAHVKVEGDLWWKIL
jgi:hypothetical protein